MLDKHIDPTRDMWEDQDFNAYIDDLYAKWIAQGGDIDTPQDSFDIGLHRYECKVYNEPDRRLRV